MKCFKRWSIYCLFWEPVPNSDSRDVKGVAEVEDITLWLTVHAILPWVGYDYRGKGNADKAISYLIEHGCLLCTKFVIKSRDSRTLLHEIHDMEVKSKVPTVYLLVI